VEIELVTDALDTQMDLEQRIRQLLAHHHIERAHLVGGGLVGELITLCSAAPELFSSLSLVCPHSIPRTLSRDVPVPVCVVSGDHGRAADLIDHALSGETDATRILLKDFDPQVWTDVALERSNEVESGLMTFLAGADRDLESTAPESIDSSGLVAGISYRRCGAGRPLVLSPLGLAPSQWEPLMRILASHYTVISISGAHVPPTSILERRAANPGYRAVIGSTFDHVRLAPGGRLLEVGCGSGAVSRWLAERTGGANPIVAVDSSRFMLSEASLLSEQAGFTQITFEEGDAHALPFADSSFDGTISITMLEEVDADLALAEMARVTRPGGQVAVVVRALDISPIVGADLPESILVKARRGLSAAGVGPAGCADASLYRRMAGVGLTDLCVLPQFNTSAHLLFTNQGRSGLDGIDVEDIEVWSRAATAAGEAFFIAAPMHAAVGTKPVD
jgi:SAM-dependent methyltransferase